MRITILCLALSFSCSLMAQKKDESASDNPEKAKTFQGLSFRSIGPALTSGRIADMAVNPEQTREWYLAVASGGVWKTTNAGTTFKPVFDSQGSYSIGCVTLDPNNPHIVWVGTGENNNQRSVAYGDGVYKSADGGKTWKNVGLKESEHIGMIRVHPSNSDVVYVAAYGPLWSAGGERGLYKTSDGGKNWELVLEVDEHTGINEVHMDPRDPNVMYATAHQRRRHVWTYISGGPGSTIYKSTDGGTTWNKIEKGLPSGKMGRIGMTISPANPDVLYAIIEAEGEQGGVYRSTNRGARWEKRNKYVTSGNYYQELYADPKNPDKVFAMDTYCHFTLDGGKTWTKLPEKNKHVDNHCMWINPTDPDHYLMGCDGGLYETRDNAAHWKYFPNLPITQFYRVTADNAEPFYNVYGGTQDNFSLGGPSRTMKNSGIDNYDWFVTNTGDGFESQIDPTDPNIVYAQSQYGWLVRYDKRSGQRIGIKPRPAKGEAYRWNWDAPLLISPHDPKTLYFAANKVFKSNDRGNSWQVISPDLSRQIDRNQLPVMGRVWGMDAVMKNKSTSMYGNIVAFSESPMEQGLLYAGTDDGLIHVQEAGSEEWNKTDRFPGVPEQTYVNDVKASLHEANTVFAVFNNHKNGDFKPYVLRSTDRGKTWQNISGDLPERGSVYSLAQDHENPELLFAGTEFGVFFTTNGGEKWIQLKGGMPTIAVRDIDIQRRENDLVLATFGRGFYILDNYSPLRTASREMLDKDFHLFPVKPGLLYSENRKYGYGGSGFQGANFYAASNPPNGATFTYYVKEPAKTRKAARLEREKELQKNEEPIPYPAAADIRAEDREEKPYLLFIISDASGKEVRRLSKTMSSGIQRISWDGKYAQISSVNSKGKPVTEAGSAFMALPGTYNLSIYQSVDGTLTELQPATPFELRWLNPSTLPLDKEARLAFQQEVEAVRRDGAAAQRFAKNLGKRLEEAKTNSRNTPGIPVETLSTLRTWELQLADINIRLNGDESLSKREFETEPGLLNRIGLTAWYSYNNQQEPTETQREDVRIAKEVLTEVLRELEQLNQEVETLEKQLVEQGAPYPEGYLPSAR